MHIGDVLDQSDVKQRLLKAIKDNRLSHALLFLGAEGSGNLALAIAFAQYLVCEQPGKEDSCGICPACVKMNKLVHPDVTFSYPVASKEKISKPKSVDFAADWRQAVLSNPYLSFNEWVAALEIENKQGAISVEESTDIVHRLSLKAVEAPCKIVIIWLPEKMNTQAANKLLKVIEEPPERTLFFLVSENDELVLPTILSRTQLVKLNRISDKEMADALISKHALSRETAAKLAHHAGGNYNEALNLLLHHEEEQNQNQRFIDWMRICLKLNIPLLNKLIDELAETGREKQKLFLRHGMHILRECLLINYGDRSMIRMEGEELESFSRFAPFVNINNAEDFIGALDKAHYHIERNANFKILFTDLTFTTYRLLQVK